MSLIIDDLPDAPDPVLDPPKTFSFKAAAMVLALKNMVTQLRAAIASLGIIASGGANKIPYRVDLGTAMADPTAGWLRLNNATQNTATAMVVDLIGNDTVDYTALLSTFTASTNPVLGQIRVEKLADASKFLVFSLTAMTSPAGYRQFTLTCIGYSSANPFVQGDMVVLSFQRNGDKGDVGPTGLNVPYLKVSDQKAAGTAGGTSVAGEQVRTLNTTVWNDISGASLSSSNITLPAGTYEFEGRAPACNTNGSQLRLYNNTDSTYTAIGSSQWISSGTNGQVDSIVTGKFTIAAAKSFSLRHYVAAGATGYGLGTQVGGGQVEVYAEAIFKKVA